MSRVLRMTVLVFFLLYFLLPLLWLVTAPFCSQPSMRLEWPDWTLANFAALGQARGAFAAFGNSIWISAVTMVLVALCSTPASYTLSRYQFKGRDLMMSGLLLFSSVVTGVAAIVPLFIITLRLGLLDTLTGIILVMAGGMLPSALFMMKDFVETLPRAYEEASLMDGATPWETFKNIAWPLLTGGTAVVGLLTFVNAWGNFLVPYILTRSPEKAPAAVAIYSFFSQTGLPLYNQVAAYSLLYTLPVLILYLLLQKVYGFQLHGGIKG
ncbi:MAG TPA: carbohydrate ABC transporter permease [Candidatus Xenobia bacterium]|jgi:multiple sugar transport system permease protein